MLVYQGHLHSILIVLQPETLFVEPALIAYCLKVGPKIMTKCAIKLNFLLEEQNIFQAINHLRQQEARLVTEQVQSESAATLLLRSPSSGQWMSFVAGEDLSLIASQNEATKSFSPGFGLEGEKALSNMGRGSTRT